ncbi:phosphotransferase enzyme family protein [Saccharibacillus sp. O23]|uniref:phosphotransferase enzyme family protein n=1 Tax=Saccharibacillus sp. O23 TaxID=2009338 RepID=UPI0015C5C168|nr:phosphotransferase [Saccharibacillus sp. O23]
MNPTDPTLQPEIPAAAIGEESIAVRSVLNPAYLKRRLESLYALGQWTECRYWLRGLNDTYRVRTSDGGSYMLRVYRVEAREDEIAFELNLLERLQSELAGTAACASPAVRLPSGRLYAALQAPEGTRFAALFLEAEGEEDPLQDAAACRAFGRSAAELHAAFDRLTPGIAAADDAAIPGADGTSAAAPAPQERAARENRSAADAAAPLPYRAPVGAETLLRRPLQGILALIGEDHAEAAFLRRYARELETAMEAAASTGLDFGICHGDMHGNNNALRTGERFTHFDFEFAAPGWRAWDLAQVKNRKRQQREQIEPLWQAFLEGYRSARPFGPADEAAVELFMRVRRFWTMGLDAQFAPLLEGVLDFSDDWAAGFAEEFRGNPIGAAAQRALGR